MKQCTGSYFISSGIRVLKESFDTIIQMRTEDLTTNYEDLDYHLKESLNVSDTQSQMIVTYLKHINILLPLIFAARN